MADRKIIVDGRVYQATTERKVIVGGRVFEETIVVAGVVFVEPEEQRSYRHSRRYL